MKNLSVFTAYLVIAFSYSDALADPKNSTAKLLFKSGFEEGVFISKKVDPLAKDYRFIRGADKQTGFSWPIKILGSKNSGLHYVYHDRFRAVESAIQTVLGHDGKPTRALYSIEHYKTRYTQLPYEILDVKDGKSSLYIRYWMKMDRASLSKPNMWRALFEWKTKDYSEGTGFRMIAYVYADKKGKPYWHWQGDATHKKPVWEIDNRKIPVPMDKWFLTEFYWHWSEGDDGRALWRINGEIVGDFRGPTTRNSKPIDFIMFTQIYGNRNPKHQWIDDIEIWDGLPE